MTTITALTAADRAEWDVLWQGYLTFYETDLPARTTDVVFARLVADDGPTHGAIARDTAGRAVGLVHWLTHPSTWSTTSYCYLEDLFVAPTARRDGVGRALIEHVERWARDAGSDRLYWVTQATNATARALYDDVATFSGFVRYQIDL